MYYRLAPRLQCRVSDASFVFVSHIYVDSGSITIELLVGVEIADCSCSGKRLFRSTYSQAKIFWTSFGGIEGHPGKAVNVVGVGAMMAEDIGAGAGLVDVDTADAKLRWGLLEALKVGTPSMLIADAGGEALMDGTYPV